MLFNLWKHAQAWTQDSTRDLGKMRKVQLYAYEHKSFPQNHKVGEVPTKLKVIILDLYIFSWTGDVATQNFKTIFSDWDFIGKIQFCHLGKERVMYHRLGLWTNLFLGGKFPASRFWEVISHPGTSRTIFGGSALYNVADVQHTEHPDTVLKLVMVVFFAKY